MAGWDVDWSTATDTDWTTVTNVTDFQNAINECKSVRGQANDTLKIAGDDIQDASFWNAMQTWVDGNYAHFVISHDAATGQRANGYYDGKTSIDAYASLSDLLTRAGLGAGRTDWRRYTTHPDDAGSDLGGKIVAGDIIGPWLFEDLQAVLNIMLWTISTSVGYSGDGSTDVKNESYGADADLATAKTEAETDWIEASSTTPGTFLGPVNIYSGSYDAAMYRYHPFLAASNVPNFRKRDIEWYVKPTDDAIGGTTVNWDAHGDGVTQDEFVLMGTDAANADSGTVVSSMRWLNARFNIAPSTWGANSAEYYGYIGEYPPTVVFRWDVTDGLAYY